MRSKIFFTGATGVIGRATVPLLTAGGHDVVAVYRSQGDREWLDQVGARPTRVDLFDPAAVTDAMAGVDTVAHFATSIPEFSDMRRRSSWAINDRLRAESTSHLVDAAVKLGVSRFVQEAVTFVYADGGDEWIDESSRVEPFWDVLESALSAERQVARFASGGGTGVVLRLSRLYGPEASGRQITAVRQRAMPIMGAGTNYVSSLHVEDAATAVVAALGAPGGTYNVSDDHPMTSADNLHALVEALDAPSPRRIPTIAGKAALGKVAGLLTISHRVSNQAYRAATRWAPRFPSAREGWEATVHQAEDHQ